MIGIVSVAAAATVAACVVALSALVAGWQASVSGGGGVVAMLGQRQSMASAVVFFDEDVRRTLPRARRALELARKGVVDRIFLVGGARPERNFYGSPALLDALRSETGFDRVKWIVDRSSRDTVSNLREVVAWFRSTQPSGPVLFVSDSYHLYRIHVLLGDQALAQRVIWTFEPGESGTLHRLDRLVWEMGAWISLLLPERLRNMMLEATRS
jgi:uncharacterized SAM-binding protein YcdF (DUF218 family)